MVGVGSVPLLLEVFLHMFYFVSVWYRENIHLIAKDCLHFMICVSSNGGR